MQDIKNIRETWITEKAIYESLGKEIHDDLSIMIKKQGFAMKISYRVKETDSIIKKIYRKESSYESIHDKVGVRIVVYFKDQLYLIDSLIGQRFNGKINKREDMAEKLGEAAFGYQSIHYDVCEFRDGKELFCEIQLRTICQDNWSELSHALAYKNEFDIPLNIKREINALSAIFELADNQFQLIQTLVDKLPNTNPIQILNYLEKFFYSQIGISYDRELSGYFLKNIATLYGQDNPKLKIEPFVTFRKADILRVINDNRDNIFFSQPEVIIILERLQNNKHNLIEYWNNLYPKDELETIANAWGTSIE